MKDNNAVIIACFDWYEHRLQYIEKLLNEHNYNVTVLLSDFSHKSKEQTLKYKEHKNVKYIHVKPYKRNLSFQRIISHIDFSLKVERIVKDIKPRFVYCLIPPNTLVTCLARQKNKVGYKLFFDIIDMWPESFPALKKIPPMYEGWKKMRDAKLNSCDKLIVECGLYQSKLGDIVPKSKIEVLHLIKQPLAKVESMYTPSDEEIVLCYLGSINYLMDIKRICQVIELCSQIKPVVVKIIGKGNNENELLNDLKKTNAEVVFCGAIYDEEIIYKEFSDCHFALNIYRADVNIGLTIKSVDYLRMGIPIINSIKGDTYDLVKQKNIGINLDDISVDTINKSIKDISNMHDNCIRVFDEYFSSETLETRLDWEI